MRGGGEAGSSVRLAVAWVALSAAIGGCAVGIETRYQAATLARRAGETERAIEGYRAVLAADPHHAAAHVYLAYLLAARGDEEAAIAHYRQALEGTGSDVERLRAVTVVALNNLAFTLAARGEALDEAEALARRALELSPDRARLLDTLAAVLLRRGGRAPEARRLLERAVELAPEDHEIQERLADACLALGDREAARRALAEALAARPASADRVRHLETRLAGLGPPATAERAEGPAPPVAEVPR